MRIYYFPKYYFEVNDFCRLERSVGKILVIGFKPSIYMPILVPMNFISHDLWNKQKGELNEYYRLMRNFRDGNNKIMHGTVLNIGYWRKVLTEVDLKEVAAFINNRDFHMSEVFKLRN